MTTQPPVRRPPATLAKPVCSTITCTCLSVLIVENRQAKCICGCTWEVFIHQLTKGAPAK